MNQYALLLTAFALWGAGGLLISIGAFNLRRHEHVFVGFVTGLIVSNWLTNFLYYFVELIPASLAAAALTFLIGIALNLENPRKLLARFSISPGQLIFFVFVTVVFTGINRGLAIFDDFQNLPIVSLLGAGDFPPHFALNPSIRFGYHYFLLLLAAQLMRLGDFYVWNALDLAHGLIFASALLLSYLWLKRMTRNVAVSFAGVAFIAFASGVRWLLLFVPSRFAKGFIENITLIGTGAFTGPDLFRALIAPWVMKKGGPIPFPFAFEDGLMNSLTMSLTGIGSMSVVLTLLLLLTYRHWRGWRGAFITFVFISSLALLAEAEFALFYASFGVILPAAWIYAKRKQLDPTLQKWIIIGAASALAAILQGGVITEFVRGKLGDLFSASPALSYFGFKFTVHLAPSILSSQLGELKFTNPYQFVAALAEIGPLFVIFPLLLMWGWKMFKARRWLEAALIGSAILSLSALFISYEGVAGETAATRLFIPFLHTCRLYFIPLGWVWLRKQKEWLQLSGLSLGLLAIVSGVVLFGIQMIAVQRPVYTYYLRDLDVTVTKNYWDRLDADALIFDPIPYRTPVVFGRFTNSGTSLVEFSTAWNELYANPDPYLLSAAGFTHIYLDQPYWEKISPATQESYNDACIKVVAEYEGYRNIPDDYRRDFRKLLDIRSCRK